MGTTGAAVSGLLPTFLAPHLSVVLVKYTEDQAQRLISVLGEPVSREEATMSERTNVAVTLPADVTQIDETGFVWAFLSDSSEPGRVLQGAIIVAGDPVEPFLARVADVVDGPGGDSIVHLDVLGVPDQAIDELRHAGLLPT